MEKGWGGLWDMLHMAVGWRGSHRQVGQGREVEGVSGTCWVCERGGGGLRDMLVMEEVWRWSQFHVGHGREVEGVSGSLFLCSCYYVLDRF